MFIGEATNTNLIIFGLTRAGLEPTIYRTRGEHANLYATDAVKHICKATQTSPSLNARLGTHTIDIGVNRQDMGNIRGMEKSTSKPAYTHSAIDSIRDRIPNKIKDNYWSS